jgi:hypothetical protein
LETPSAYITIGASDQIRRPFSDGVRWLYLGSFVEKQPAVRPREHGAKDSFFQQIESIEENNFVTGQSTRDKARGIRIVELLPGSPIVRVGRHHRADSNPSARTLKTA